jgi:hypothetical protein
MPATLPADVLAVMADRDADAWPAATAVRAGAVDGDDADRVTDR